MINNLIEHMLLEQESKKIKFHELFIGILEIKIQKIQLLRITMLESKVIKKILIQRLIY